MTRSGHQGGRTHGIVGGALLAGPCLLDEPSRGSTSAQGIAIVVTTSDLIEALTVADRIVVTAAGRATADLPADAARSATAW